MKGVGRIAVLGVTGLLGIGTANVTAAAESTPAPRADARAPKPTRAATAPPAAAVPAVSTGTRSMSADDLARAGRAVEAAPSTTIYESRLADGTLELSDRPPGAGAADVARRNYPLPQDSAARQRAEAERDYWRRQADAFERRQQDRDRALERDRARLDRAASSASHLDLQPRRLVSRNIWGWPQYEGAVFTPAPSPWAPTVQPVWGSAVGGVYASSPGAAQGRAGGFIGSGFATSR